MCGGSSEQRRQYCHCSPPDHKNYVETLRGTELTNLYPSVAMIRGHDSVLGEHKIDRATCLPPLELDRHRGVGLGVPLGDLLEPVHDVPGQGLRHILRQLEFLLLVEKPCPVLVKFGNMN